MGTAGEEARTETFSRQGQTNSLARSVADDAHAARAIEAEARNVQDVVLVAPEPDAVAAELVTQAVVDLAHSHGATVQRNQLANAAATSPFNFRQSVSCEQHLRDQVFPEHRR
ncbi:hypothetical protein D9M70_605870 [compost metagenome]